MNSLTTFSIPSEVMCRSIGDEIVILDLAQGTYYGLNNVGSRIWALMVDGRTVEDISMALVTEYEVTSDDAERDLRELAGNLIAKGLVSLIDS